MDSTLYGDNDATLIPQAQPSIPSGGQYHLNDAYGHFNHDVSSPIGRYPLSSPVSRTVRNTSSVGNGRHSRYASSVCSRLGSEPLGTLGPPPAALSPGHYAQSQSTQPSAVFSSESEITCPECEADPNRKRKIFKGPNRKNSFGKHILNQHSSRRFERYKCSLQCASGSPCLELIKSAQNLRRHVEDKHPKESHQLPPTDAARRRPNDVAKAKLAVWFQKVSIE